MKNSENSTPTELESSPEPAKGVRRLLWIAVAAFSLFWIFFPEFTDLFPVIGWLDEGVAVVLFFKALSRLGVRFPFLEKLLKGWPGRGRMRGK